MTDFPSSVYSPRTKNNKSGVVYTPANDTQLYAEDISKLDDEVVSMEENLADKIYRVIHLIIYPEGTTVPLLETGFFKFIVPPELDGYQIVDVQAAGLAAASDDWFGFDIVNSRLSHSIFTDFVSIDEGEKTSATSEDPPVINTSYDDLESYDELRFDSESEFGTIDGLQVFIKVKKIIT